MRKKWRDLPTSCRREKQGLCNQEILRLPRPLCWSCKDRLRLLTEFLLAKDHGIVLIKIEDRSVIFWGPGLYMGIPPPPAPEDMLLRFSMDRASHIDHRTLPGNGLVGQGKNRIAHRMGINRRQGEIIHPMDLSQTQANMSMPRQHHRRSLGVLSQYLAHLNIIINTEELLTPTNQLIRGPTDEVMMDKNQIQLVGMVTELLVKPFGELVGVEEG